MGTAPYDVPPARTVIERQVIELLDADPTIDATTLVSQLEFRHWLGDDAYADWHASTALEPMLRALFLRELLACRNPDSPYTKMDHERRLREPSIAEQLGFDLNEDEQAPCRTTYDRTWTDRLSDACRQYLAHTAARVRDYAHENGIPLGMKTLESTPADTSTVSQSTKDRAIRRTTRQVLTQVTDLIFPLVDFGRADNATYETETYLGAECLMSLNGLAAEQGMEVYNDLVADRAGRQTETDAATAADESSSDEGVAARRDTERAWIQTDLDLTDVTETDDRPATPTGDAHLRTLQLLDRDDIRQLVDEGIGVIVKTAARQHDLFDRRVTAAIDLTTVGYWADGEELEMVLGAPPDKEYDECYEFVTLSVVGETTQFTLAVRPRKKGDRYGDVVRDLLMRAKQHVRIDTVYADAGFAAADVIRALEQHHVRYVISMPKRARIKRFIRRMDNDVAVKHEHTIYGRVRGGPSNAPAETTLVVVPSNHEAEKSVAFITNKDVHAEIGVEREWTQGVIDRYSRRMAIENSYKSIKDFLAWTTSTNYCVRFFHFAFAVLLYDIWLVTDLLGQESTRLRAPLPRLKATRFLYHLDSVLIPGD